MSVTGQDIAEVAKMAKRIQELEAEVERLRKFPFCDYCGRVGLPTHQDGPWMACDDLDGCEEARDKRNPLQARIDRALELLDDHCSLIGAGAIRAALTGEEE